MHFSQAKTGGFVLPSLPGPSNLTGLTSNNELHTDCYHLISADLRNTVDLDKKLSECHLDANTPTLIVTECVLVYMTADHSNTLLAYFSAHFKQCCVVNYEQVNLDDRFGQIMLANMQSRACKLLGFDACSSLNSQTQRFVNTGFAQSQVITMTDYYLNKLSENERRRVESLEFLDENELLIQLLDHYCICIATNNASLDGVSY